MFNCFLVDGMMPWTNSLKIPRKRLLKFKTRLQTVKMTKMKKRVKLIHTKLLEVISGKYQYFHPFIHYKVEKSDLWFFQTFGSFSTRRRWQKVFTKYIRLDQEILWKMFIYKSRPVQASLRSLSQVEWEVQTRFKHAEGCFNQNSSWTWKLQWFHNRKLISRKVI